jgi:hypothetical protein
MQSGPQAIGRAARSAKIPRRRYEFAGWDFKPDKRGIRQKRAILREVFSD